MKILIIEDEPELSASIVTYLAAEGYLCETALTFQQAMQKTESYNYDCILLDVTLPDGNGLRILQELKANKNHDGVIVISAKNSIEDRLKGLHLGADDYLAKPFHLSELSARVAAVIRRRRFDGNQVIVAQDLTIDLPGKTVYAFHKSIDFTRREFDLLLYLVSNKNRVVSKNALAEHLSGDQAEAFSNFDFVYTHIKNVKRKLLAAGCPDYIRTVYGLGYKFEV